MDDIDKRIDTLNERLGEISKKLELSKNIEIRFENLSQRVELISKNLDFHAKWLEWHHHLLFNNSERGKNKDEER